MFFDDLNVDFFKEKHLQEFKRGPSKNIFFEGSKCVHFKNIFLRI